MESSRVVGSRMLRQPPDPSTIQDRFLVQYVGWYACPGDGYPITPRHHGWLQWFDHSRPNMKRPRVDLFPDVSSYSASELYPVPNLKTSTNEQTFLFSHFHWMVEHGVDGAFLYRWAGHLRAGQEHMRYFCDEVMDHVRKAAEKEGRVFAIQYSVTDTAINDPTGILEEDWKHIVHEKGVLSSPNYLRENGKPVIALMGFGWHGANHTPMLVRSIVAKIRKITPGGAYIIANVPAYWRTLGFDADPNSEFVSVWLDEFDAICPNISPHNGERMKADMDFIRRRLSGGRRSIDYIPSVYPGQSKYNLTNGSQGWNEARRDGGRYFWNQVYNASKLRVRTLYGVSWDDYCGGFALTPVVPHKHLLPNSDKSEFMALDEDDYSLPSDWYMRICGVAAEALHQRRLLPQTMPWQILAEYWSNQPKHKELSALSSENTAPRGYLNNIWRRKAKSQNDLRRLRKAKALPSTSPAQMRPTLGNSLSQSKIVVDIDEEHEAINPQFLRAKEMDAFADDRFEALLQLLSRILVQRVSVGKRLAAIYLDQVDAQHLTDFLDRVLDEANPADFEEKTRKRILSLLSRLAKSSQVFPARCKLTSVQCDLTKPLYQGGFGYICKGAYMGRTVCVKAVRLYERQQDSALFLRVSKELILWSHLSHPNILSFYGVWLPDESAQICIVSPWMSNGDLNHYLSLYPDAPRLPLLSDVIYGLNYLHKAKIIHADLKAANVLVSDAGRAMLADFGISQVASSRLATTTIVSLGTPQWTAPELATGDGVGPTSESDIWSFGCVVYEALTGNVPFHWYKASHQLIAAMMRRSVTPLQAPTDDGSSQIDTRLRNIMERCFNYVEKDRPTSADIIQFFAGLNIANNRPSLAKNDTTLLAAPKARAGNELDYDCVCKILKTIRQTTLEQDDGSEDEGV
ncbi:hypothetical protein AN958_04442 [Leucoagaricus sp. SymC.cos]|nr:hypothetical protein AN958_04442 [Leucoagaricus sp. SymC.cos]